MKGIFWNNDFAYGVGLLATDGCLSPDRRHIEFSSKDFQSVVNFKKAFKLTNKITNKSRGRNPKKQCYRVQFGDIKLYNFLIKIGLSPRKSHSLGALKVPKRFFVNFLRGVIDGDGCIDYFMHPESKKKQFRIRVVSASKKFLYWLNSSIGRTLNIKGTIKKAGQIYELRFYKSASKSLVKHIYFKKNILLLKRKFDIANLLMGGCGETGIRASLRS